MIHSRNGTTTKESCLLSSSAAATAGSRSSAPAAGSEAATAAVLVEATTALARAIVRATATAADGAAARGIALELTTGLTTLLDIDSGAADRVGVGRDGRVEAILSGELNEGSVLVSPLVPFFFIDLQRRDFLPSAC